MRFLILFAALAIGLTTCARTDTTMLDPNTAIISGKGSAIDNHNRLWLTGVNFAGAEFGKQIPGEINKDYHYPKQRDIDYVLGRGANTVRLPFRWERLQLNLAWELEPRELALLDGTVAYVTGRGAHVVLDPHNYARYLSNDIGSKEVPVSAFASFWAELAAHFKDNERVIFGLMNEPHRIRADDPRILNNSNLFKTAVVTVGHRFEKLFCGSIYDSDERDPNQPALPDSNQSASGHPCGDLTHYHDQEDRNQNTYTGNFPPKHRLHNSGQYAIHGLEEEFQYQVRHAQWDDYQNTGYKTSACR